MVSLLLQLKMGRLKVADVVSFKPVELLFPMILNEITSKGRLLSVKHDKCDKKVEYTYVDKFYISMIYIFNNYSSCQTNSVYNKIRAHLKIKYLS